MSILLTLVIKDLPEACFLAMWFGIIGSQYMAYNFLIYAEDFSLTQI